jgi:hypothetical protein
MGYSLNGINFADFGIQPGQAPGSHLAIEGLLDMPARIEKTDHDWGDRAGVEPYVSTEELFYGGRDLTFHGVAQGASRDDVATLVLELYAMLDGVTELVTLASDWGSWSVYVSGQIEAIYVGGGVIKIKIPFREPVVTLTGGVIPTSSSWDSVGGIDGVDFQALGFTLVDLELMGVRGSRLGGHLHRPAPKEQNFKSYGREGYQVTKPAARELSLTGVLEAAEFAGLETIVKNLIAVFAQPGTRLLYIPSDQIRIVFAKGGFKVAKVTKGSLWRAMLEITLIEAEESSEVENYLLLATTVGDHVTTTVGQKILIKL